MDVDPTGIPVTVRGFTWGAAAGWATFVAISGTIAAVLRAVGLAKIVELVLNRGKDLRAEERADEMADAQRAERAEQRAQQAEAKVVYLSSAVSLLIGLVETMAGDDPHAQRTVKQARDLISMAADSDDGFGRHLRQLANVPDTKVA